MQKVYSDMDMQNNSLLNLSELTVDKLMSTMINSSNVYISQSFDAQNITADCTLIRCSGSIVIASGVTVNAIDSPSVTATGDGTLLRNGYAVGDFFIGTNSPAERAGGEWTQLAAGQTVVSSGAYYPLGGTGGIDSVVLTIEQMPSHNHRVGTVQEGSAAYGFTKFQAARDGYIGEASATVDSTGGGQAHTNMPPYYVTNLWRRTA